MMSMESKVRIGAGLIILITVILGAPASPLYVSSYILWLTFLAGVSLFQSGFTKFCPLEMVIKKLGW